MAQLVERLLPIPEVVDSNLPSHRQMFYVIYVNCMEKMRINLHKESGICPKFLSKKKFSLQKETIFWNKKIRIKFFLSTLDKEKM